MKIVLVLLSAATLYLVTACNTSTDNTSVDTDSSLKISDSSTTSNVDTGTMSMGMSASMDASMQKMHSLSYTGDFDIDFAKMMIIHHQGALDMALLEVEKGNDEKMKAMAAEIITKQEKEQQELEDFVKNYKPSGMKHGEGELEKSMNDMMGKGGSMSRSGNIDKDFAIMMANHHQEGVAMAKLQLKHGMDSGLKRMAQKMITDQQKEITQFEQWLAANK